MAKEALTAGTDRLLGRPRIDLARGDGFTYVVASVVFFLGSAVLTQSGQPGASTPAPWIVSHVAWVAATGLVAIGTVRLVRRLPALEEGIAGHVAAGAFGLGVLHSLQWATWVYVDVIAHRGGAHGRLLEPLLHPFGTGHMLMYGILLGAGVAALAWGLRWASVPSRFIVRLGLVIGAATVATGTVSLLIVAPVRGPTSLATIGLIAVSFGWLLVLGLVLYRGSPRGSALA